MKEGSCTRSEKKSKKCDFWRRANISGPRRKSSHSTAYIDGFGSPNGPKCTLGQKVRFFVKIEKFHEIHENSTFFMKIMKIFNFEVKIATRNGHLSTAKSTFSLSGAPAARLSGNFAKFHKIS